MSYAAVSYLLSQLSLSELSLSQLSIISALSISALSISALSISALSYLSSLASRHSPVSFVLNGLMQAVMRLWQYAGIAWRGYAGMRPSHTYGLGGSECMS